MQNPNPIAITVHFPRIFQLRKERVFIQEPLISFLISVYQELGKLLYYKPFFYCRVPCFVIVQLLVWVLDGPYISFLILRSLHTS